MKHTTTPTSQNSPHSSSLLISGGFLDPEKIVDLFGIEKGDHVADFGAGHGYYTIPLARRVGGNGKVYAVDIQRQVLDVIRTKAKLEHLLNIETVLANLEEDNGSKIKEQYCDFVVISNILFQADEKQNVVREAYRILRAGGRLAMIEWDMNSGNFGPTRNLRVSRELARNLALDEGFEFDREFAAGVFHYGLLFKKTA